MNVLSVLQGTSLHQMLVIVVMPALLGSIILSAIKRNVKFATQEDSPLTVPPQLALTAILVSMLRHRQLPNVFSASLGTTVTKGAPQNAKVVSKECLWIFLGHLRVLCASLDIMYLLKIVYRARNAMLGSIKTSLGSVAVSIAKLVIFVQMTKHQIVVIHLIVFRAQLVRI
mgnify:CR=1 FL=1